MNELFKILKYLLLVSTGLVVLFYMGFFGFFILMGINDEASYYGGTVDIGPIDYNSLVIKAENAGYDLSGPYTRLDNAI